MLGAARHTDQLGADLAGRGHMWRRENMLRVGSGRGDGARSGEMIRTLCVFLYRCGFFFGAGKGEVEEGLNILVGHVLVGNELEQGMRYGEKSSEETAVTVHMRYYEELDRARQRR